MDTTIKIDLHFPATGREVPLDHGYALFSAISRQLEAPGDQWLHENDAIALHPIRGRYAGPGRLALAPRSGITLRLPAELIPKCLPLAGKAIQLGEDKIRLGIPQPLALKPVPNLYAHLVTTKNGQDEARFEQEIARQLAALEVQGRPQRGPRRTLRVKDKRVVAHALLVTELTAEESIRLQEAGLGGRRKLGCGVFVPWEGK